ncbi:hypothetical protein KCA24_32220, partial [Escherichia coli]|nr:hypothetical protein [Escherichia coli]
MDDKQLQAQAAFSKASQPAIDASLNLRFSFPFRHPYPNLQHFFFSFLPHRPYTPAQTPPRPTNR